MNAAGHVEAAAEAALVAGEGTLAADVSKLAHHGSRTSSSAPSWSASAPSTVGLARPVAVRGFAPLRPPREHWRCHAG